MFYAQSTSTLYNYARVSDERALGQLCDVLLNNESVKHTTCTKRMHKVCLHSLSLTHLAIHKVNRRSFFYICCSKHWSFQFQAICDGYAQARDARQISAFSPFSSFSAVCVAGINLMYGVLQHNCMSVHSVLCLCITF